MANTTDRQFSVHARHSDRQHARLVTEASFEAAALAYLEDCHAPLPAAEISIVVRDVENGHERCFRVDFASGKSGADVQGQ